jgi:hypothetical protein
MLLKLKSLQPQGLQWIFRYRTERACHNILFHKHLKIERQKPQRTAEMFAERR